MTTLTDEEHEAILRRRSLIAIAGALLLLAICTPVWLVYRGSTSTAAFADSEVLDKNRLGAAKLDLEVGEGSVTFEAINMAPGDAASGHLELTNAGTLPLIYEVSGVTDGDPLADWLRFDVWNSTGTCTVDDSATRLVSDVQLMPRTGDRPGRETTTSPVITRSRLAVGQNQTMCLGARLLLEAPNDVQGRRTEIDIIIDAVHDLDEAPSESTP